MKSILFFIAFFIFLSGDLCADSGITVPRSISSIKNNNPSILSIKIQNLSNKKLHDIDIKLHEEPIRIFARSIELDTSNKWAQLSNFEEQCFKNLLLEKGC